MKPLQFHTLSGENGGDCPVVWFWYFLLYSFLGFLLEVAFARATGGRPERKCLMVLPLCPVYGLGACVILLLSPWAAQSPPALLVLGGAAATAAEYATAVFYEEGLGVAFWDYRGLPGNVQGRVCLPFSAAWGVLSLVLVYGVHPRLAPLLAAIPLPVTLSALGAAGCDLVLSCAALKCRGDIACLGQWLRRSA